MDRSPGGPGAFPSLSSPAVSSDYRSGPTLPLTWSKGPCVLSPSGTAPPPRAGGGRGWRSAPPSAPPARPTRFVALLVRLREPWTRSSHDGGCSRRRRTRGARWGRRARGRRGLGANVSLCVSPFPCLPFGVLGPPTPQEGLDDGPDFLSEEDRGVSCVFCGLDPRSLPRRGPRRGPGCAAALGRPPDLRDARPALLQPFVPGVGRFSVPLVPWPLSRPRWAIQPCAELAFPRPRCRWGGRVGTPPSLTLWATKPIFRPSRWYRQNLLSVAFWNLVSPFSAEWYGFGINLLFCNDFFAISKSQFCPKRFLQRTGRFQYLYFF